VLSEADLRKLVKNAPTTGQSRIVVPPRRR
jgi:hypothetical protein